MRDEIPGTECPALVTGATGFIGRHLVRTLLQQNRRVLALAGSPGQLDDLACPRLEILSGRVEDARSYRDHLTSDLAVFHLAATRNRPSAFIDRFRDTNVSACYALAEACARAGVAAFVHISSAVVFGGSGSPRTEEDGFSNDAAAGGYQWSRQQGCRRIQELAAAGLRVVTVYPTIVFGPDERTHPNRITNHLRTLLRTRIDWVVGGGAHRRNLVFVSDVVDGILLAESSGQSGQGYILGGEDWSPRELNRAALAASGKTALLHFSVPVALARLAARAADRIRRFPRAVGYEQAVDTLAREWCFNSRRAVDELGYRWMPIREGVRRTVEFLKAGADDRG